MDLAYSDLEAHQEHVFGLKKHMMDSFKERFSDISFHGETSYEKSLYTGYKSFRKTDFYWTLSGIITAQIQYYYLSWPWQSRSRQPARRTSRWRRETASPCTSHNQFPTPRDGTRLLRCFLGKLKNLNHKDRNKPILQFLMISIAKNVTYCDLQLTQRSNSIL